MNTRFIEVGVQRVLTLCLLVLFASGSLAQDANKQIAALKGEWQLTMTDNKQNGRVVFEVNDGVLRGVFNSGAAASDDKELKNIVVNKKTMRFIIPTVGSFEFPLKGKLGKEKLIGWLKRENQKGKVETVFFKISDS